MRNLCNLPFKFQHSWKNRYRLMLLAISSGYFYVFISAWLDPMQEKTFCVYKNLTGYPCPGCGMTRSTISLFKGNIIDSFFYNPLAIVVNIMVLVAFVWMIVDLAQNKVRFEPFIRKKMHHFF
ncbi:MAG: DUF2752 domain-containing protein [Bacteroidales bacterium]|nr:DUF2752 domain-containing protein [Bacteroidales bacterium]